MVELPRTGGFERSWRRGLSVAPGLDGWMQPPGPRLSPRGGGGGLLLPPPLDPACLSAQEHVVGHCEVQDAGLRGGPSVVLSSRPL